MNNAKQRNSNLAFARKTRQRNLADQAERQAVIDEAVEQVRAAYPDVERIEFHALNGYGEPIIAVWAEPKAAFKVRVNGLVVPI